MRTTVDIDEALLAEAKSVAARTHRTLSVVVSDALRVSLHANRPGGVGVWRGLPAEGSGGLVAGVDLDDRDAVAARLGDEDPRGGRVAPA